MISDVDLDKLNSRIEESSIFLFPIRRKDHHFLMITQSSQSTALFSNFDDFEKDPENSKADLILTFFDELKVSKGIIPVKGDIFNNILTKTECEMLLKSYLDYYLQDELFTTYTQVFNADPDHFKHEEYITNYFLRLNKE